MPHQGTVPWDYESVGRGNESRGVGREAVVSRGWGHGRQAPDQANGQVEPRDCM